MGWDAMGWDGMGIRIGVRWMGWRWGWDGMEMGMEMKIEVGMGWDWIGEEMHSAAMGTGAGSTQPDTAAGIHASGGRALKHCTGAVSATTR